MMQDSWRWRKISLVKTKISFCTIVTIDIEAGKEAKVSKISMILLVAPYPLNNKRRSGALQRTLNFKQ